MASRRAARGAPRDNKANSQLKALDRRVIAVLLHSKPGTTQKAIAKKLGVDYKKQLQPSLIRLRDLGIVALVPAGRNDNPVLTFVVALGDARAALDSLIDALAVE